MELTQQQLENIQIDYGIVYVNFGTAGEALLGPTRGGGTFNATKTLRDIEFDGRKGKTKGAQVIDEINAMLSVTHLDTSMETLRLAMPYATYDDAEQTITCKSSNVGIIPDGAYLDNITMFAKVIGGGYKKINLYNAMSENDFSLAAAPKAEGTIALEVSAHWDALDDEADLYKIEDVANIGADTTAPTITTVPADAATGITVSASLTATFNEDIKKVDINSNKFILMKASDGSIVPGTLSYNAATKVVTFDPTSSLSAATAYIWTISGVRDTAGNTISPVVVNFTTA